MAQRTISFCLPIIPTAQKRPRFFSKGKYTGVYKDNNQINNEDGIMQLLEQYIPTEPLRGAIQMRVYAYLPLPKSKPQWWKEAALGGYISHTTKPDLDNLVKNIKDCMKRLGFYHDDSQISKYIDIWKTYAENPRWFIELVELDEPKTKKEYEEIIK